jgi:sortase A
MGERNPLYPDEVLEGDRAGGRWRRFRSSVGLMADSWRGRPGPRRALGALSVVLMLGGVGLFAYPFVTNFYADWRQSKLEAQFHDESTRRAYITRTIRPGEALTQIEIPALDVEAIVVEGTTPSALRAGAGHYQQTSLPCEKGNAAIAGHRTTYSKPFANLQDLADGDEIVVTTPVGRCTYEVVGDPWITHPGDFRVLQPVRGSVLTLTTCDPPGSAERRLIVRAELVSSEVLPADGGAN